MYSQVTSGYIESYRAAVRKERLERSLHDFFLPRKPRTHFTPHFRKKKCKTEPLSPVFTPRNCILNSRRAALQWSESTAIQSERQPYRLFPLLKQIQSSHNLKQSVVKSKKSKKLIEINDISAWGVEEG